MFGLKKKKKKEEDKGKMLDLVIAKQNEKTEKTKTEASVPVKQTEHLDFLKNKWVWIGAASVLILGSFLFYHFNSESEVKPQS